MVERMEYGLSESSDSSDEEEMAQEIPGQRQQDIYNQDEMHEKLEEIMWEGATFADTRATTSASEEVKDIEDDLQRELVFYNQALEGAKAGIQRLQSDGVAWLRPHDYYAEMVKSDGHMARIKQQLVYEQKQIEEADERRKQREAKKSAKETQAERLKEKAQAKKSSISAVTKLRKQRQKSGFAGELDLDAELAAMDRPKGAGHNRITASRTPTSKKREAKNAKFGFGGRKRLGKQNDAVSAANMDSFKGGRGRGKSGSRGGGRGGGGASGRPGRSRREAERGGASGGGGGGRGRGR